MTTPDPHLVTIKDFVKFAYDMDKSKGTEHLMRLIVKPSTLKLDAVKEIKENARKCFAELNWDDIKESDVFIYKTGKLSLSRLQAKCSKNNDDMADFNAYGEAFDALYKEEADAINLLMTELEIDPQSEEASFMKRVFNEIGEEFIDIVKNHNEGEQIDIMSFLPNVANIFKSGKLTNLMKEYSESGIRMSKIFFAIAKLMEKYEQRDNEKVKNKDAESSTRDEQ